LILNYLQLKKSKKYRSQLSPKNNHGTVLEFMGVGHEKEIWFLPVSKQL
jgi:hypothetical protein